ncbi:MAG TPA: TRAM domain-containing protein [Stellaceae bacterium]|jgi:23S rRNA (uracil1939-C5)-methyltransferase
MARSSHPPPPEVVELAIDELGSQGDGVASWRGETVFVPFTLPGDRVRARLGSPRQGGREARVMEWLARGPGRAEPVCRHFARCGGCTLQHLDAETYRAAKLAGLLAALRRVGIDTAVVGPLRTVPPGRRRAGLGLRRPKDARAPAVVGFRERSSHAVVDMRECPVLEPALWALVAPLRDLATVVLPPGGAAEVNLTRTDSGIDMLVEAYEPPNLAALEGLAAFAAEHDLARIVWRVRGTDTPVVQRRPVRMVFSGTAVPSPPGGFIQANAEAEATLIAEVVAAVGDARPALDLYAGLGTFTFALTIAGPVHAVEGDAAAVVALTAAGASAERRNLDRDPLPPEALAPYAAAVFDPPRAGALRQAAALAASTIPTIAAVSCNPATFARDAVCLIAGGYRLDRVTPVDQFAWTPHLEVVGVFRR